MDAAKNAAEGVQSTLSDSAKYAQDKFSEATSGASKEGNKNIAKDSNAGVGTRLNAAGDAMKDSVDEHGNKASAEGHKQSAKH